MGDGIAGAECMTRPIASATIEGLVPVPTDAYDARPTSITPVGPASSFPTGGAFREALEMDLMESMDGTEPDEMSRPCACGSGSGSANSSSAPCPSSPLPLPPMTLLD